MFLIVTISENYNFFIKTVLKHSLRFKYDNNIKTDKTSVLSGGLKHIFYGHMVVYGNRCFMGPRFKESQSCSISSLGHQQHPISLSLLHFARGRIRSSNFIRYCDYKWHCSFFCYNTGLRFSMIMMLKLIEHHI